MDFDSLIKKYGTISGELEKIFEFGSISPELIAINCIVCDGSSERENRKILLSDNLFKTGIDFGKFEEFK